MFWSLSFQLLPDENIIEDSIKNSVGAIRPAYSVFLTNRRAIFRFDGLGSSLTQSFFYKEIVDIRPCKRLFINYLEVKTVKRNFILHIADADYWAKKIIECRDNLTAEEHTERRQVRITPESKKRELLDMLTILRKNSLLTDQELEEKIHLLGSLKL